MAQQSNKEGPFLIGVDAGTESLRAGVFDLQGNPLAFSYTAYKTTFPKPGWAEQNPQDWWEALAKSVKNYISAAGISSWDRSGRGSARGRSGRRPGGRC